MAYGHDPARFVKNYSSIKDVGKTLGGFLSNIPKVMQEDEEYKVKKQQFADIDTANTEAYKEMQQAAEAFGVDPGIITPPGKRQDTDEYTKMELTNLLTAAKGAGVDKQTMVEKITQLGGAGQVPGVAQEQTQLNQLQQQQQGVNVRQDNFGAPQPQPGPQAQQDIQALTGGQEPSVMDSLSPQPGAEMGGAAINLPGAGEGTGLQQPEQLSDIMNRLQVEKPESLQDNPERRQEALDAGISGSELDQTLSDLRSGNMGLSDFDDKISKAQTSQAKKMQSARKLEDEKIENVRRRLQQNIGKVPIYLDGQQIDRIDPNRDPRDYEIGTEQFAPKERVVTHTRGAGYGNAAAQESGKNLRKFIAERTKIQTQINNLTAKADLDPKVLEAEGLDKTTVNRQIRNMLDMVDDINTNINQITKKKPLKEVRKRTMPRDEMIIKLRDLGKDDRAIDQYLRIKGFKGLGDAISGSNTRLQ